MSSLVHRAPVARFRAWFTRRHWAQIALLVQPLIVFRTGGEYLRLKWADSDMVPGLIEPLFIAVSAVGVVAIVSLLLYFNRREVSVIVLTLAGIAALIVYKLMAMPGLG